MSTAQLVPETWELTGDDAAKSLKQARFGRLVVDSFKRFRAADCTSHARSLAFAVLLALIPGVIALIGLADVVGAGSFRTLVADTLAAVSPGPTGDLLTSAIGQGQQASNSGSFLPLLFGTVAMMIAGVTAFGQIERGANRIYGVEEDRPFAQKYGLALGLMVTSGVLVTMAFVLIALGRGLIDSLDPVGDPWFWFVARWTLGIAIAVVSFAVVFKLSPRRHQPAVSWLTVASLLSTLLWVVATVGLALFWRTGSTFGETYGPLAGLMGLILWSYLTAVGLFFGLAFAAQLEAFRAGAGEPQDEQKVADSEPEADKSPDPTPRGSDHDRARALST